MGVATLGLRPPPELKRNGIFSEIILKIFSGVMFIIILGSLLFFIRVAGTGSRHGQPARSNQPYRTRYGTFVKPLQDPISQLSIWEDLICLVVRKV